MAKLHIKNRYGVTPDNVLTHRELSWKAKGLYGYIQSKPEDWEFSVGRFEGKDGKDSTQSGIWELEQYGYLTREKHRQKDGTWEIEYTLYERPEDNPNQGGKPVTDTASTMAENPATENPATENPSINTKTDSTKTDSTHTEKEQTDILSFWNSKKIIVHEDSADIQEAIKRTRKKYKDEQIVTAINNYEKILHSKLTFWSHKWTIIEFLTRKNGISILLYKTEEDYYDTSIKEVKEILAKKRVEEIRKVESKAAQESGSFDRDQAAIKKHDIIVEKWFASLSEERQNEITTEIEANNTVKLARSTIASYPKDSERERM